MPSSFFTARAAREGVIDGDCCVNKDYRYKKKKENVVIQRYLFVGKRKSLAITS